MNLIMDRPEIDKIIESCPNCQLDVNNQLIELFNRHKVVIYIKNIDVFAEVTRQTFLYDFFDNINSHSMKVSYPFQQQSLLLEQARKKSQEPSVHEGLLLRFL